MHLHSSYIVTVQSIPFKFRTLVPTLYFYMYEEIDFGAQIVFHTRLNVADAPIRDVHDEPYSDQFFKLSGSFAGPIHVFASLVA